MEQIVIELRINHSLTGEQAWETSENEFSDSECPNLKEANKDSLENCKAFCLAERGCTAINYDSKSTDCVLRGCNLPVVPPTNNRLASYDSYWLGTNIQQISHNNNDVTLCRLLFKENFEVN